MACSSICWLVMKYLPSFAADVGGELVVLHELLFNVAEELVGVLGHEVLLENLVDGVRLVDVRQPLDDSGVQGDGETCLTHITVSIHGLV